MHFLGANVDSTSTVVEDAKLKKNAHLHTPVPVNVELEELSGVIQIDVRKSEATIETCKDLRRKLLEFQHSILSVKYRLIFAQKPNFDMIETPEILDHDDIKTMDLLMLNRGSHSNLEFQAHEEWICNELFELQSLIHANRSCGLDSESLAFARATLEIFVDGSKKISQFKKDEWKRQARYNEIEKYVGGGCIRSILDTC